MDVENERPFAVVTNASSGIGFELAKQFVLHGYDLLIAADTETIFEAQDELLLYGTNVECLETNLGTFNGVELLNKAIKNFGRPLEAIAINAVTGESGPFTETELRNEINLINQNVISAVHLTKCVLQDLFDQGRGKILFTPSTNLSSTSPQEGVLSGSKAFITSFAESIRMEARDYGITVTVLIPGATITDAEGNIENDPASMARQGFEALMAGKDSIHAGSLKTKLQGWAFALQRKISDMGSMNH